MNNIIKGLLIVGGAILISALAYLAITMSRTEFNFANGGKIICVNERGAGFGMDTKETCFAITPIGMGQDVQTFKCDTLNGEIVVSKK